MATPSQPEEASPRQDGEGRLAAIERAARQVLAAQDESGLQDALRDLADAVHGSREPSSTPWPGWDRWYAEKRQQSPRALQAAVATGRAAPSAPRRTVRSASR